ncbi:hypothetical protein OZX74_01440 [Bifidobacterium sp. ESL0798]|uniref:hypothetical protein n=1 Tax=Bifidobacterium sp. ESL0798 TaxID=2983235 RepID=UPI0023F79DBB|nr:hypothetical protein [Bifidobacterium sp. ESL0798]WEV74254.1 hypothetical protein OZX74_01440 [Bifidobacterium sp. ESL0798]
MTSEQDKKTKHNAKPTKHAVIMRGVVAPIFGLLAVLFIVLGALNMTVWKPAREVSATTSISGARYVVTDSGMLNLLAKSVNIEVSAHGDRAQASAKSDKAQATKSHKTKTAKSAAQTCVALGNAKDATGWIAGQQYVRVTGLDDWKRLSTKTAMGPKIETVAGGDEIAFKNSDMWTSVKCGDSAMKLNLNDVRSDQVMVVDMGASARKSARPSVTITMHWLRDRVPNHAVPFFVASGVCVVLTILSASLFAIMANESFKRKRAKRRERRKKAKAEEVSISEAMTGSIAVLRRSLVHSSHNHRPSHKIQPSDLAGSGASSSAEDSGAGAASNGSLLSAGTGDGNSDAEVSAPSIIDPTRRNLVADMQMSNDTDEDAEGETDTTDTAEEAASDSHQVLDGPSAGQTGETETETDQPQSSETEDSSEPAATDAAFTQAHEDADAADADENHQDMSRFARHRGKPEQESESDATASSASVGRHSRHAAASDTSDDHLRSANSADNRDGSDKRNDAGDRDDANNANGHEEKDADFRTASVAVSLEHQEGDSESGNAEHANTQNGEARTASSADELIDKDHAQAETTVISAADLRDYFARFSSETSDGDTTSSDTNDDTTNGEAGPAQADSEATGEASNAHGDGETE